MRNNTSFSPDTIAALSTPEGIGAVAVIRVSGPNAFPVVNTLFATKDITQLPSHTVHVGDLKEKNTRIDQVLVTLFRAPRSYTGEDVIEISAHGSPYIVRNILSALCRAGASMAAPGAFTERAFLNGKIDLTQVESIADLIHAQSKAAHQVALRQLKGGVSVSIRALKDELIRIAGLLELELDFSEEDVLFASRESLAVSLATLREEVAELLQSFSTGQALKEGIAVVIAGAPNVGKSTLLNALLQEERAIVSDVAGTTRDLIEAQVVMDGLSYRLMDTAGIRETQDPVEQIGIKRAKDSIQTARIVLYLFDATQDSPADIQREVQALRSACEGDKYVWYINKKDALSASLRRKYTAMCAMPLLSAQSRADVKAVQKVLRERAAQWQRHEGVVISSARQYEALYQALEVIKKVANNVQTPHTDRLAADLRYAIHHLQVVVGEVANEQILNSIFSKFCIGK